MLQSIIGAGGGGEGGRGSWVGRCCSSPFVCSCCFVRVLFRVLTVSCHHGLLDITVMYFICY